jgi:glycosyltransferase involved in cell wall biosynthesis
MKIAIDVSPLKSAHRFRGIGFYTKHLIQALKAIKKPDFEVRLIEKGRLPQAVDLVHYPYFDLFFPTLPLKIMIKTVVTIHDVIPLLFPDHYPPGIRGKLNFSRQKAALKGVSAVITDSQASKKDVAKHLKYPNKKIFVVHLAPQSVVRPIKSKKILDSIMVKYQLPKKFVLYVGDVNYHKNVLGLIKACKRIQIPLVIVGKQAVAKDFNKNHVENQPLVRLIGQYGNDPDIIRLGFVPDKDFAAIYNLASVYCQPSFYEGFGLPVLEAMVAGTPVVAAKAGSLPEVCGEAALMVSPEKPDHLAMGIQKVLSDKNLCDRLIKSGFQQVKKFSWEKTAAETINIYRKVNEDQA